MSELRDIRLLIARNLDVSRNVKMALMDVMNIFDSVLDAEGWQAPRELTEAMRRLDRAIVLDDEPKNTVDTDDLLEDEPDVEFVDLEDVENFSSDDEEDGEEDDDEIFFEDSEDDDESDGVSILDPTGK